MKKICIVFLSLTGNTEKMAKLIAENLHSYKVDFLNMDGLDPNTVLQYDAILIGAFTWGDGKLHYDSNVFYKKLNKLDLSGKVVGCFGSGDHSFRYFCAAVDLFQELAISRGAIVVEEGLKVHLMPDTKEDLDNCYAFTKRFKWNY